MLIPIRHGWVILSVNFLHPQVGHFRRPKRGINSICPLTRNNIFSCLKQCFGSPLLLRSVAIPGYKQELKHRQIRNYWWGDSQTLQSFAAADTTAEQGLCIATLVVLGLRVFILDNNRLTLDIGAPCLQISFST